MSGGTDSSVAALLLQDAGYEVTGITFRFYEKTAVRNTWTMHGNCAAHWAFLIWCTMPVPCFRRNHPVFHSGIHGRTYSSALYLVQQLPEMAITGAGGRRTGHLPPGHRALCQQTVHRRLLAHHLRKGYRQGPVFFLWGLPQSILERMCLPMGGLTKTRYAK